MYACIIFPCCLYYLCNPFIIRRLVLSASYSFKTKKLLLRLDDIVSASTLKKLSVDTVALMKLPTYVPPGSYGAITGVIITLRSTGAPYDFISRYFAPWNGIPEDPVTGSAHTVLAPYWSNVLGKNSFFARQDSARGGDLRINITSTTRVSVAGQVRT